MSASLSRQTVSTPVSQETTMKPGKTLFFGGVFFEDPTHNWVKNKQTAAGISYFSAVEKPVSVILVLQYDLLSATRGQFQGGNLQFAVFLSREILN